MASDLFGNHTPAYEPLASRLRPQRLEHYIGQEHVIGPGTPLRKSLDAGQLHSVIFWGPPGVGKTTLARLIAQYVDAAFLALSAVMSGVKEIREAVQRAQQYRATGRKTVLFIDEVHRFNKSQQDAFLPYVEDGTFIFVGATTENPSFELNNALLSRAQVYVLKSLSAEQLQQILQQGIAQLDPAPRASTEALQMIADVADGDARRALNMLEFALQLSGDDELSVAVVKELLGNQARRFDKGGEAFYDQISALHKSVRGSDPDAALYWFARMLDGGCDPLYIARRVVRMASEDIGNADPRALTLCVNAWDVQERLGSPEGELAIAQAVTYLACAPKSNAVYKAFNKVRAMIASQPSYEVPLHLRNAPTKLMKQLDYGAEYRYAHDEPDAFAAGENYFPPELKDTQLYEPVNRGLESKIRQKLEHLQQQNRQSAQQRYPRNSMGESE
ncbi:replication-associated recombination protein A [Thalassolituus hydrocarboniclasticus]|uniref:Replication-associated recombination protein A n=1 Tax=Thalassolituus hydrocarboniclasticus TaxID=2742796 RepID=A0ABY6AC51_9GAMM|nr:replication-associated recombination protein A [Thalassolituus hydrocarboniclasticus]UXD87534.1 replication-associated recombination protein A [Thalassolituus hydrocarboniclasticus]